MTAQELAGIMEGVRPNGGRQIKNRKEGRRYQTRITYKATINKVTASGKKKSRMNGRRVKRGPSTSDICWR